MAQRLIAVLVRYQFQRTHQAFATTYISDKIIVFLEFPQTSKEFPPPRRRVLPNAQASDFGQGGQGSGSANRVAGIGVALIDRGLAAGVVFNDFGNLARDPRSPKREVPVGNRLGGCHGVRLYPPNDARRFLSRYDQRR